MKIKLNLKEIALGASFGLALSFLVGLKLGIFAGIACAVLWPLGGSGKGRAFRFVGVPAASIVAIGLSTRSVVAAALAGLVLAQGYGIPSAQPPDAGSPIGRFFYQLAKMREGLASLYTRGALAALLALAYVPIWGMGFGWKAWAFFAVALVSLHLLAVKFVEGNIEI